MVSDCDGEVFDCNLWNILVHPPMLCLLVMLPRLKQIPVSVYGSGSVG